MVFGDDQFDRSFLVAVATKFGTKWAIIRFV